MPGKVIAKEWPLGLYQWSIILFSCVFVLPKQFQAVPGTDSASSGFIGINEAIGQSLLFGKDFLSHYGPLGFLTSRYTYSTGYFPLIFLDIFTIGVLIYCMLHIWKINPIRTHYLIVPFVILLMTFHRDIAFLFFIFFLFLVFHAIRTGNKFSWLISMIISWTVFYMQIHPGFLIFCLFQIAVWWNVWLNTRNIRQSLIFSLFHIAGLIVLAVPLHTHLWLYLLGGYQFLIDYPDALTGNLYGEDYQKYIPFIVFTAFILVGFIFWFSLKNIFRILNSKLNILFWFLMMVSLFVLYKQTFIQLSPWSVPYFFFYGIAVIAITLLFTDNEFITKDLSKTLMAFLCLSIAGSTALGVSLNPVTLPYQELVFESPVIRQNQLKLAHDQMAIDSLTVQKLKNKTVDVYPADLAYAYYNHLNYLPRPVAQSFLAYNTYLSTLNYNKYISESAPACLIFTAADSDRQCISPGSDALTMLGIIQGYQPDTITISRDTLLILKRRPHLLDIELGTPKLTSIQNNKEKGVSASGKLAWLKANIHYSLQGYLLSWFFQPPEIWIEMTFDNGRKKQFKINKPALKQGILLKQVQTSGQALDLFNTPARSPHTITHIKFNIQEQYFKKDIELITQDISFL